MSKKYQYIITIIVALGFLVYDYYHQINPLFVFGFIVCISSAGVRLFIIVRNERKTP